MGEKRLTNGLSRESIDQLDNVLNGDVVGPEDTCAHTDTIFSGRSPVELLHTTVTNQGSVEGGEVVTSDDDRNTGVVLLVVHSGELDVGGVVGDVHEGGVDHLVVDGVLRGAAETTGTSVEIVDEEAGHLPLLDYVRRLTVPLTDQLRRLSGVSTFQFSGAHHDGAVTQRQKISVGKGTTLDNYTSLKLASSKHDSLT